MRTLKLMVLLLILSCGTEETDNSCELNDCYKVTSVKANQDNTYRSYYHVETIGQYICDGSYFSSFQRNIKKENVPKVGDVICK